MKNDLEMGRFATNSRYRFIGYGPQGVTLDSVPRISRGRGEEWSLPQPFTAGLLERLVTAHHSS
jgi:hypothetical protein